MSQEILEFTKGTPEVCARQRVENMAVLGAKKVLELCVGPSLPMLEGLYAEHGIEVWGNDIDIRRQVAYRAGKWVIGKAENITYKGFDGVVFAPPLSKNSSGRREDALSIEEVSPTYAEFVETRLQFRGVICIVLPGRAQATPVDRSQYHKLLGSIQARCVEWQGREVHEIQIQAGRVTKYYDIYLTKR